MDGLKFLDQDKDKDESKAKLAIAYAAAQEFQDGRSPGTDEL